MMTPNLAQVAAMLAAHDAGTEWALSLTVGDSFMGCMPEAMDRYADETCQRMFMTAALDVLEKHKICTNGGGVITRYSRERA